MKRLWRSVSSETTVTLVCDAIPIDDNVGQGLQGRPLLMSSVLAPATEGFMCHHWSLHHRSRTILDAILVPPMPIESYTLTLHCITVKFISWMWSIYISYFVKYAWHYWPYIICSGRETWYLSLLHIINGSNRQLLQHVKHSSWW